MCSQRRMRPWFMPMISVRHWITNCHQWLSGHRLRSSHPWFTLRRRRLPTTSHYSATVLCGDALKHRKRNRSNVVIHCQSAGSALEPLALRTRKREKWWNNLMPPNRKSTTAYVLANEKQTYAYKTPSHTNLTLIEINYYIFPKSISFNNNGNEFFKSPPPRSKSRMSWEAFL